MAPACPPKDISNSDPARRARNLVGTDRFWNLSWNPAAHKFTGG